jgi:hypothetical protein
VVKELSLVVVLLVVQVLVGDWVLMLGLVGKGLTLVTVVLVLQQLVPVSKELVPVGGGLQLVGK